MDTTMREALLSTENLFDVPKSKWGGLSWDTEPEILTDGDEGKRKEIIKKYVKARGAILDQKQCYEKTVTVFTIIFSAAIAILEAVRKNTNNKNEVLDYTLIVSPIILTALNSIFLFTSSRIKELDERIEKDLTRLGVNVPQDGATTAPTLTTTVPTVSVAIPTATLTMPATITTTSPISTPGPITPGVGGPS